MFSSLVQNWGRAVAGAFFPARRHATQPAVPERDRQAPSPELRDSTQDGPDKRWPYPHWHRRYDERDTVLSRLSLVPGTEDYEAYYGQHPHLRDTDDRIRALPGVHAPTGRLFSPFQIAADKASFYTCYGLQKHVNGPPRPEQVKASAGEFTEFLVNWTQSLGAHRVGVAELREHHCYSHAGYAYEEGKALPWGQPIARRHKYALVFTTEMEEAPTNMAPLGPASMEASRQYLDSSVLAVQLAWCIRNLGYSARAQIFGNSELMLTTVAKEAGLGEIGRMGLLMDPLIGPRVRIAAVTTDIPLTPSAPTHDPALLDFCSRCNKCAACCPARAIPSGPAERHESGGMPRWRIDAEACVSYWHSAGTYCGRCLAVCPVSRPGHGLHPGMPRWLRGWGWYQRFVLWLDDRRHGKRPAPWEAPPWLGKRRD